MRVRKCFLSVFAAAMLSTALAPRGYSVRAMMAGDRGIRILADRSLFSLDQEQRFEKAVAGARLDKLGCPIPHGTAPLMSEVMSRYGDPDRVQVERAPEIPEGAREAYLRSKKKPPVTWRNVNVYYYESIGFGVDQSDPTGPVLFVTNWSDHPFGQNGRRRDDASAREEHSKGALASAAPAAEMEVDGNWDEGITGSNLGFTVLDNAVTSVTIANLDLLGCPDGGSLATNFDPPLPVNDNSINVSLSGATNSNLWVIDVSGSFTGPSAISGDETIIIFGDCGFTFGVSSFSASRQPDYVLFTRRSVRQILSGQSTIFTVGFNPIGGFNEPVNIQMDAAPPPGVSFRLSSNTIQPGGTAILEITTANDAPGVLVGIPFTTSTGSAVHRTFAILDLHTFNLSVSPGVQTVARGGQATFKLDSETLSFASPVTLSADVFPANEGVSVSFSQPTLVPGQSTSFTVTQSPGMPTDSFSIAIIATSGQVSEAAVAGFVTSDPGFDLGFGAGTDHLPPGGSENVAVNVVPLVGFGQPVALSASVEPDDGNVSATLSDANVTPGGSTSLSINVKQAASLTSTYSITVTGMSGTMSVDAFFGVTVSSPNFSLFFDPSDLAGPRGTPVSSNLMINRIAGFNGNITVTAPDATKLNLKIKPRQSSTTGDSIGFKFKLKGNAVTGIGDFVFVGQDDLGRRRTAVATLEVR